MNLRRRDKIALVVSISVSVLAAVALIPSAPVAYLPGIQTAWEQRAADMGITVIVTDDERNCGHQLEEGFGGGCFDPATPDRIYVAPWVGAADLERTALHELAHVWQYRHGLPGDECGADRLAAKWGAVGPFYYCDPE